jgi:two-component system, OmpR family, response regulator
MRNQNIVRDMVERRGAAPAVPVLAPASSYAPLVGPRSRRQLRDAMRTSAGSPDVTELNLHVEGFSVVVRFFPDDVSTRGSGRVAAEAQSLLLNALQTVIRGSCPPATRLLSRSMPAVGETGLDAEVNTIPQTTSPPTVLRIGDLELDLLERRARRCDRLIALRPREFGLLRYMMERSDKLLTRAKLLQEVWNYKFVPQTNLVDVHMGRLRRKVDGTNEPAMIRSVRGGGFVLSAHPLTQS